MEGEAGQLIQLLSEGGLTGILGLAVGILWSLKKKWVEHLDLQARLMTKQLEAMGEETAHRTAVTGHHLREEAILTAIRDRTLMAPGAVIAQ